MDRGRAHDLARLDQLGVLNPETGEREGTEYARLRHGQWVQATGQIHRACGQTALSAAT